MAEDNSKRRKVIIKVEAKQPETQIAYGKYGTEVETEKGRPVFIKEFYTAEEMIRDSIYAIDSSNNVLVSDGMISICWDTATLDKTGKFYLVKMPSRNGKVDTAMQIWIEKRDGKGITYW